MLRKLLTTTVLICAMGEPALAADLPYQKSAPVYAPPPPAFTWTGVYIGGQVGYSWGYSRPYSFSTGALGSDSPGGVIGGGHIGYNYQIGQFVLGLEGDVDGRSSRNTGWDDVNFTTRNDIDGSVRGRVGYAILDRVMVYGTGGAAFGGFKNTYWSGYGTETLTRERTGWTVGGGVEYALDNNWSLRAEYRYSDYGKYTDYLAYLVPGGEAIHHHETDHRALAGFSYKFDLFAPPAPLAAKY